MDKLIEVKVTTSNFGITFMPTDSALNTLIDLHFVKEYGTNWRGLFYKNGSWQCEQMLDICGGKPIIYKYVTIPLHHFITMYPIPKTVEKSIS